MRLLFVAPYVPSRIRVRPYNLIRALVRRGHDLTVATLQSSPEEEEAIENLRRDGVRLIVVPLSRRETALNCLRAIPTRLPLQAAYCRSPRLEQTILTALHEGPGYDAVHVEHLRGVQYALAALHGRSIAGPPVVWDAVDSISLLFERALAQGPNLKTRLLARLDLARTRAYETALMRRLTTIVVTSPADAEAFTSLSNGAQPLLAVDSVQAPLDMLSSGPTVGGGWHIRRERGAQAPLDMPSSDPTVGGYATVHVVPNGVDLDYFSPQDTPRDPATLVFTGKMSYHANVAAVLDLVQLIMPIVWATQPETQVLIVGQNPTPQVTDLARQRPGRVIVTGATPDLRPYLARATVAVCPLRYGVGIQNKALEAMAMGAPVVASRQAVSALQAQPEHDLLVAENPADFAAHLLLLLNNAEARARLGQAGRRFVQQHHDWSQSAARFEQIYSA